MSRRTIYGTLLTLLITSALYSNFSLLYIAKSSTIEEQEFTCRRFLVKTGTYFELNNSEYLNVTITSTVTVRIILSAPPQMIDYLIESVDGSDSSTLTLGNLQPLTTYYMYEDSYRNEFIFTTDSDGSYTYLQDLSQLHHVFIQLSSGTTYICESTVLTQDIYGSVEICSDNIVVDLNGYSIIGGGIDCGKNGVIVKNGTIRVGSIHCGGSDNTFENIGVSNYFDGITIWGGSGNTFRSNNISYGDSMGILLVESTGNNIYGNTLFHNWDVGIFVIWCYGNNKIFHNNFIDNVYLMPYMHQAEVWSSEPQTWDDGYPSGGNYWSDYKGVDFYCGPNQNEPGSDSIGDTVYAIYRGNQDRYPLMNPYTPAFTVEKVEITKAGQTYSVQLVSNSTITDVAVGKNILHFEVSGPQETSGYVSTVLPIGLNTTNIKVFLNGTKLTPPPYPVITSNGTHYFVYFAVTFTSLYEITVLFDPVTATVDQKQDTLNLAAHGTYVTVYIELPEGYDLNDIDKSTIMLNDTIAIDMGAPTEIGDYDKDGTPDLMVKFDRALVSSYILAHVDSAELFELRFMMVSLTLTGELYHEIPFQGSDDLKAVLIIPTGTPLEVL